LVFNLKRWEMQGEFYYRLPTSKYFRALNGFAPRQITEQGAVATWPIPNTNLAALIDLFSGIETARSLLLPVL